MLISILINILIGKITSLGLISFIVNFFLLILIKNNIFGVEINNLMEIKITNKIFFIQYFVMVFILISIIKYNMPTFYLDEITVKAQVNGIDVNLTGDILPILKETFGDALVFTACARLAQAIIVKNKGLASLSKIGIMIGSGSGGLFTYKMVNNGVDYLTGSKEIILKGTMNLKSANLSVQTNQPIPDHPLFTYLFGISPKLKINEQSTNFKYSKSETNKSYIIEGGDNDHNENSKVLAALNKENPKWLNEFRDEMNTIDSPNDNEIYIISFLVDNLSNLLYLKIISIYLLLMLLVILFCKFILNDKLEFKTLRKIKIFKWHLGERLANLLNWYISIWHKSNKFWIFFIIIMLIIFNGASLFSIAVMLHMLKNIS